MHLTIDVHRQRLLPLYHYPKLRSGLAELRLRIPAPSARVVAVPCSLSWPQVRLFYIFSGPFISSPSHRKEFERITEGLSDALGFTRTIGMGSESVPYEKGGSKGVLGEVDFYTR